jgi:hypothetical protein
VKSLIAGHHNGQRQLWLIRDFPDLIYRLGFYEPAGAVLQAIAARELPIRKMY